MSALLVYGYCKSVEQKLSQNIPDDIIQLCIIYYIFQHYFCFIDVIQKSVNQDKQTESEYDYEFQIFNTNSKTKMAAIMRKPNIPRDSYMSILPPNCMNFLPSISTALHQFSNKFPSIVITGGRYPNVNIMHVL